MGKMLPVMSLPFSGAHGPGWHWLLYGTATTAAFAKGRDLSDTPGWDVKENIDSVWSPAMPVLAQE